MEVLAPRVNANDDEAKVTAWHATPWQIVTPGDLLCSIETTKATVDIEANAAGFFHPAARVGDTVKVGQILAWVFPEKSETLLAEAKRDAAPVADNDIIISVKAQKLMEESGLVASDFPGRTSISTRDVEALMQSRLSGQGDVEAIIASLAISEDAILIWGGGYQGQVVLDILAETGAGKPVVVIDRNPRLNQLGGLPVLRPENLTKLFDRGLNKAHVCIGNAVDKIGAAETLKAAGFTLVNVIHPSAVLSPCLTLGENVFIGPLVLVGVDAVIGDLSQINNGASVAHHTNVGRAVQISDGARLGGLVRIGEGCLIGIGTIVNSRVAVGARCTLVSGITVYDDVQDDTVVRADGTHVRTRR